jgi:betaine-aldehyde dehydrogenase
MIAHPNRLFIGNWVLPSSDAQIDVITPSTEELFVRVAAARESQAVDVANDTDFGLNASVFTYDAQRAYQLARQIRGGTVGHNSFRTDFSIAFGGFKQSGIGREGGREGLLPFLASKTVILDADPVAASEKSINATAYRNGEATALAQPSAHGECAS